MLHNYCDQVKRRTIVQMPTYKSYHGRENVSYGTGKVTCRRFYVIRGADPLSFNGVGSWL